MALSIEQLYRLNNLLYEPSLYNDNPMTSWKNRSVGDFVKTLLAQKLVSPAASTPTGKKVLLILRSILRDPQLRQMTIVDTYRDPGTEEAACTFADISSENSEAVVAYRGTVGGPEWYDDAIGGGRIATPQQEYARLYLESQDLSGYDTVTATGHSKGGNEAQYTAIMSERADRCVSFDGQGFSDEFIEAKRDRILANQEKVTNHSASGDYVNVLLNHVGEQRYYETHNPDGFLQNHSLHSMIDAGGRMRPSRQSPTMREFDAFVNSYLRSMSPEEKRRSLDFAGRIMALTLGNDPATAGDMDIWDLLSNPKYRQEGAYFFAYLIQYERVTLGHLLNDLGDNLGFPGSVITSALNWFIEHPGATEFTLDFVNFLWVGERLSAVLDILKDANRMADSIEIDLHSGKDIAPSPESGDDPSAPPSSNFDWQATLRELRDPSENPDSATPFLSVRFDEFSRSIEILRSAIEEFERACFGVACAANELGSKWLGGARDAFMNNQHQMLQDCERMTEAFRVLAEKADSALGVYRKLEG